MEYAPGRDGAQKRRAVNEQDDQDGSQRRVSKRWRRNVDEVSVRAAPM